MRTTTLTCLAFAALAFAGCTKDNRNYCDPALDPGCSVDASIDSRPVTCNTPGPNLNECMADNPVCSDQGVCIGCRMDNDCNGRGATPVCFGEPAGACVACDENDHQSLAVGTTADHCPTAPNNVCDGATHTCRPCEADSECTSGVCDMNTGACASGVIYVDNRAGHNGSDANACTSPTAPCLTAQGGVAKLPTTGAATRYLAISASDDNYPTTGPTKFTMGSVYIVGLRDPAAPASVVALDRTNNGPDLEVDGNAATVTLVNIQLNGATGTGNGDGLSCVNDATLKLMRVTLSGNMRYGITSTQCNLTMDRSIIRSNSGGGGFVSGTFSITNSWIVDNIGGDFGGLSVSGLDASDTLAHNTFAKNSANNGQPGSLGCTGGGTARQNILYGSTGTALEFTGCNHAYSLIGTTVVTGDNNIAAATIDAIAFENITTIPRDYHLKAGSVALGVGGPNDGTGRLAFDIDGEPRPTTGADIGADERP